MASSSGCMRPLPPNAFMNTGPANDAFVVDVSKASEQVAEEFNFQFVAWSEVAMPAFAGENVLATSLPDEASFTQARSCRHYCLVARGRLPVPVRSDLIVRDFGRRNLVESDCVGRLQALDSPRLRLEIVDQIHRIELQVSRQACRLDDPGQIRSLNASMAHRTCDPKTGDAGTDAGFGHELEHDLIQPAKVFARIRLFVDGDKMAFLLPVIAEACMRSPDIGRQNHFSKFLQRRPSRSISSSDSFGPQVPAG